MHHQMRKKYEDSNMEHSGSSSQAQNQKYSREVFLSVHKVIPGLLFIM